MAAELTGPGSLLTRRDAIARDYKTAYSLGPAALNDTSQGHHDFAWKIRLEENNIFVSRINDAGDGWTNEILLFTYEGIGGIEADLAFDQNGAPIVAVSRLTGPEGQSRVWLYWYNSVVGAQVFEDMTPGKTPRLVMDDVESRNDSDVLLFYLNDTNQRCEYRTQRDLYSVVEFVPVDLWYDILTRNQTLQTNTENMRLEEVLRTTDRRISVIASLRNPITGRYQLLVAESFPYPARVFSSLTLNHQLELLEIITVYVAADHQFAEFITGHRLDLLELVELIQTLSPEYDPEDRTWVGAVPASSFTTGHTIELLENVDLIITAARQSLAWLIRGTTLDELETTVYVLHPLTQSGQSNLDRRTFIDSFATVTV